MRRLVRLAGASQSRSDRAARSRRATPRRESGRVRWSPCVVPNENTTSEITVAAVAPATANKNVALPSTNGLCASLPAMEPWHSCRDPGR